MIISNLKTNWSNLSKGLCPLCDEVLNQEGNLVVCNCGFEIKLFKYLDLIKGKQSNAYKNKIRKYEQIKDKKRRNVLISENQRKETLLNLNRMFLKGQISKEEFEIKMAYYK